MGEGKRTPTPADADYYVEITYVTTDGQEIRNEIPADPKEVDTSYLGRMLQSAYDRGRLDQSELDSRIMEAALTDIRLRVEKRLQYQKDPTHG